MRPTPLLVPIVAIPPHRPGGLGLFDSGFDVSQWGLAEWGTVGAGALLLAAMFGGARRVRRVRRVRRLTERLKF